MWGNADWDFSIRRPLLKMFDNLEMSDVVEMMSRVRLTEKVTTGRVVARPSAKLRMISEIR